MVQSTRHLVKDDVFFTADSPPALSNDITLIYKKNQLSDNRSSWAPTPCLSPVTSPSDFLYDREPLFDGIGDFNEHPSVAINPASLLTDSSAALSAADKVHDNKSSHKDENTFEQDLDWSALSSASKDTLFEKLTHSGIDWCRYCGTTEGVNWRPGPWGKRTLCNKHGCDYKGYGLSSRLPRLDLSAFAKEKLEDRRQPIVQQFCVVCQSPENLNNNRLISCKGGCSRAYHQYCYSPSLSTEEMNDSLWFCNSSCSENGQRNKVYVDLPRKYLPLKNSKKIIYTYDIDFIHASLSNIFHSLFKYKIKLINGIIFSLFFFFINIVLKLVVK
ncbi:hypothetical protein K501DRAFT_261787 [Backusella circina FSU 941]|nr:hypothetical protein K501DRAFT_261787 [Backusella circina FSU 941]